MDNLDWDASRITGCASSSWKNQQQPSKESLMMSNSFRFVNGFSQIQQQISNEEASSKTSFDPIHILSSWNITQRQEAATRLAADSVAAKSGTGSTADSTKSKIGSSPPLPHNNYMPQLGVCGLMADLGSNGLISKSRSPDCLLSATNMSSTNTNDGVPLIFSNDSETLWTNNNNAVSSAESAINAFIANSSKPCNMVKRNHHHAILEPGPSTEDLELISENDQPKSKKSRPAHSFPINSSNVNLLQASSSACPIDEPDSEAVAQMKEMIYGAAALRSVFCATEEAMVEKPKRKNVRISTDPQTAAARRRRERISERIRALQKLVPGGSNMDTASLLDEAANYLKFLRTQVNALEAFGFNINPIIFNNNFTSLSSIPFSCPFPMQTNFPLQNLNPIHHPKC